MIKLGMVRLRLGQSAPFQIVVTDPRGMPWEGAKISIPGAAIPQNTDDKGVATFPDVPPGQVTATIELGDYHITATGNSRDTMFVSAPLCAPGPILSKVEIVTLLGGISLFLSGIHWKNSTAKTVGELVTSAGIFTTIYRHSCRW